MAIRRASLALRDIQELYIVGLRGVPSKITADTIGGDKLKARKLPTRGGLLPVSYFPRPDN